MCGVSLWFYGYYTTHIVTTFNFKGNHNFLIWSKFRLIIVTTFNFKGNHNVKESVDKLTIIVTTFNFKGNHNLGRQDKGSNWNCNYI